jgi:predicted CXXCH cytochrome family protein
VRRVLLRGSVLIMVAAFIAIFSGPVIAKVTGPCGNCHTMHNSQGGTSMITGYNAGSGPYGTLLRANGCLGCHATTGADVWQGVGGAPIVYNTSAPTYGASSDEGTTHQGLAGGNFYWVKTEDSKGHNIFPDNPDSLTEAPGNTRKCSNDSCHWNLYNAFDGGGGGDGHASLKGRFGCTGCHMVSNDGALSGFHHADDTADVVVDNNPAGQGWYRFLSGHKHGNGHGVSGIEDDDWQKTVDSSNHNEYLGYVASKNAPYGLANNTMTGFCCGCHGKFHLQESSGEWIRHPSDAVIPDSGEYQYYITYDPLAPVARPSLSGWTVPGGTVTPDTDMVMCLSCHRPHGSPYPDMLRWDYDTMIAGGGPNDNGCFICHTSKDDGVPGNP